MKSKTITEKLVSLIRDTSSSLPPDVIRALKAALRKEEKNSSAAVVLKTILENCAIAAKRGTPLCQDTGTLTFFVDERLRRKVTPAVIGKAVAIATEKGYLRKNTIDAITGKSYDDNCAEGAPVVHYVGSDSVALGSDSVASGSDGVASGSIESGSSKSKDALGPKVTLILKGGGSENMSRQYSLPDAALGAGRDLEGVRKCILDAVQKIQGYGCAPGILGVSIGGDRATGYEVAKEQLLRPLDENRLQSKAVDVRRNERTLATLEKRLLREANSLGIGPMGLGGKTTLLGVKIAARPRVPASFFVTVAYMCWACRRRTVEIR